MSVQAKDYITLTYHYITLFWELKSPVLTSRHTAVNIASELQKLAGEWKIKDKVVSIVTYKAANKIAATCVWGLTHLLCFPHRLNLVVTDAIKSDDHLMRVQKKAKNMVSFLYHCAKATERLSEVQRQLSLPPHKQLLLAGIRLILCLKESLTSEELIVVKKAVCVLKPFAVATEEIGRTEKHAGVSKVCNQKFILVNLFHFIM